MDFGLTVNEKKQLLALLDKIQANHCKNFDSNDSDWNCIRKSDHKICPLEYMAEDDLEICFYCPVFLIHNVMEDE